MEDTAGWRPDPTGRHEERYFRSPGIPTNWVRNDGIESTDEGPSDRGPASDPISATRLAHDSDSDPFKRHRAQWSHADWNDARIGLQRAGGGEGTSADISGKRRCHRISSRCGSRARAQLVAHRSRLRAGACSWQRRASLLCSNTMRQASGCTKITRRSATITLSFTRTLSCFRLSFWRSNDSLPAEPTPIGFSSTLTRISERASCPPVPSLTPRPLGRRVKCRRMAPGPELIDNG